MVWIWEKSVKEGVIHDPRRKRSSDGVHNPEKVHKHTTEKTTKANAQTQTSSFSVVSYTSADQ